MHILDLNEQVMNHIFGYLKGENIYTNLRRVCIKFKQYADQYMILEGSFLLFNCVKLRNHFGLPRSTIKIKVYRLRGFQFWMIFDQLDFVPICHNVLNKKSMFRSQVLFGGTCNGKFRVGCYCVICSDNGINECYHMYGLNQENKI